MSSVHVTSPMRVGTKTDEGGNRNGSSRDRSGPSPIKSPRRMISENVNSRDDEGKDYISYNQGRTHAPKQQMIGDQGEDYISYNRGRFHAQKQQAGSDDIDQGEDYFNYNLGRSNRGTPPDQYPNHRTNQVDAYSNYREKVNAAAIAEYPGLRTTPQLSTNNPEHPEHPEYPSHRVAPNHSDIYPTPPHRTTAPHSQQHLNLEYPGGKAGNTESPGSYRMNSHRFDTNSSSRHEYIPSPSRTFLNHMNDPHNRNHSRSLPRGRRPSGSSSITSEGEADGLEDLGGAPLFSSLSLPRRSKSRPPADISDTDGDKKGGMVSPKNFVATARAVWQSLSLPRRGKSQGRHNTKGVGGGDDDNGSWMYDDDDDGGVMSTGASALANIDGVWQPVPLPQRSTSRGRPYIRENERQDSVGHSYSDKGYLAPTTASDETALPQRSTSRGRNIGDISNRNGGNSHDQRIENDGGLSAAAIASLETTSAAATTAALKTMDINAGFTLSLPPRNTSRSGWNDGDNKEFKKKETMQHQSQVIIPPRQFVTPSIPSVAASTSTISPSVPVASTSSPNTSAITPPPPNTVTPMITPPSAAASNALTTATKPNKLLSPLTIKPVKSSDATIKPLKSALRARPRTPTSMEIKEADLAEARVREREREIAEKADMDARRRREKAQRLQMERRQKQQMKSQQTQQQQQLLQQQQVQASRIDVIAIEGDGEDGDGAGGDGDSEATELEEDRDVDRDVGAVARGDEGRRIWVTGVDVDNNMRTVKIECIHGVGFSVVRSMLEERINEDGSDWVVDAQTQANGGGAKRVVVESVRRKDEDSNLITMCDDEDWDLCVSEATDGMVALVLQVSQK